jgi:hypothetical protein
MVRVLFIPIVLALVGAIPSAALEQYNSWNLTVNPTNIPFQTDRIQSNNGPAKTFP